MWEIRIENNKNVVVVYSVIRRGVGHPHPFVSGGTDRTPWWDRPDSSGNGRPIAGPLNTVCPLETVLGYSSEL